MSHTRQHSNFSIQTLASSFPSAYAHLAKHSFPSLHLVSRAMRAKPTHTSFYVDAIVVVTSTIVHLCTLCLRISISLIHISAYFVLSRIGFLVSESKPTIVFPAPFLLPSSLPRTDGRKHTGDTYGHASCATYCSYIVSSQKFVR